jgi:hypothetical protein
MCAVVRLRALMAQQSARLITNRPSIALSDKSIFEHSNFAI